jgi:hypothetical protein
MTKEKLFTFVTILNNYSNLKSIYTTNEKGQTVTQTFQKFQYFIAKNLVLIQNDIKILQDLYKTKSDKFIEFDKKRIEIKQKYAEKDNNNKIKIDQNNEPIIDNNKIIEAEKEFEILKQENEEAIKEREQEIEDFNNMLKEEIDNIEFKKIKIEDIHPDVMPSDLAFLIENNLTIEE